MSDQALAEFRACKGRLPPDADIAGERARRVARYLRKLGHNGVAAAIAAFMWGVRGMDLDEREKLIVAQWPEASSEELFKATKLYHRVVAANENAERKDRATERKEPAAA
jgi:hypothetical protein